MSILEFYNSNKSLSIIISVLTIIGIFIFGLIFFPSVFYDQFIWKYFWGPIISDSLGYSVFYNGVQAEEKFTIISEIVYGFLIILVLIGLYKLMKRRNITVNSYFLLAIMP